MEFKVYEGVKPKLKDEKEVSLQLVKRGNDMAVIACDKSGIIVESGNLIEFRSDGTIYLCPGVSQTLGFKLDMHNRIVV